MRSRMLTWLVLVIFPAASVCWFTLNLVDVRLSQRLEADLANLHRVEAARLEDSLQASMQRGRRLAADERVIDLFDQQGVPGAGGTRSLTSERLGVGVGSRASDIREIALVAADGRPMASTEGFSWQPFDRDLVPSTLAQGSAHFGNAFRGSDGGGRLGLVVPVRAEPDGPVLGALLLETDLAPILTMITYHDRLGATSEAHIAQATPTGDVQFITGLRFEPDAAFNKSVPSDLGLPVAEALRSSEGQVLRAEDYRGTDSILAVGTIEATGWGLVLKIDASEAYAPVAEIRKAVFYGAILTMALILGCTAVLLNPLARRLRRLSAAAGHMADGRYQLSIGDGSSDEIGDVARSIDRLAADLEADIQMRNAAERKLRHQLTHDHLTGIHNRHFVTERMQQLSDEPGPWSVLFLDLDGFKPINDTHGHDVGDEVLKAVAHRLARSLGPDRYCARWGGDEFVVVLPETDGDGAKEAAAETLELFTHPVSTSAGELSVGCSVGIAASDGGVSLDALLSEADAAMFNQKPPGRRKRTNWSRTERDVAVALRDGRIEVWYQPVLSIAGDIPEVVGAEALVRLRAVDGQLLPPAGFLPSIINRAIGIDLDQYVAAQAANVTAGWLDLDLVTEAFRMSVNLGAGSLGAEDLVARMDDVLTASGLPPEMLVVEVSEAAEHINMPALEQLSASGVGSAIDDVGISHSNFDRLLQVRPSFAKLDRRWLATSRDEALVLASLVETCRGLGLQLVAEGIETPEQHRRAQSLGIDLVQGFLFGRPVHRSDFERHWLRAGVGQS